METTKDYYKKNSDTFIKTTLEIEMNSIYEKYLPLLPESGSILDAGCGSGRDSLFFRKKGFKVLAIDSCEEFVIFTGEYAGVEAQCIPFNDVSFNNEFDGIWACASLLHLNRADLSDALNRFSKALKPGGILYSSFKYGNFSGERNGRIFTDLNEESYSEIINGIAGLKIIETWITDDRRKDREEKWLNALVIKEN